MAYRLPSERVTLNIEDGPTVEVEKVSADLLYHHAVGLASAFAKSRDVAELYGFFIDEAQPTWQIVDHRGVIPATQDGMYRVPIALGLRIILAWLETFVEKATAVDAMVPAGPARDKLNAMLRAKRKVA